LNHSILHLSWFPVALLDAMVFHLWHQKWSTFVNIERFVFASEVCPDVLGARFIRMRIRLPLNHVRLSPSFSKRRVHSLGVVVSQFLRPESNHARFHTALKGYVRQWQYREKVVVDFKDRCIDS
jgi:hypothetical protein